MLLVRDEPLPSLFAQSYGHAYCGAGDSHKGVAIRHRFAGDDSQLRDVKRPRPSRVVIKKQFPGLPVLLDPPGL
jgi:hypothetical protein